MKDSGLDRDALLEVCRRRGITGSDAASAVDTFIGQLSTDTVRVVAALLAERRQSRGRHEAWVKSLRADEIPFCRECGEAWPCRSSDARGDV